MLAVAALMGACSAEEYLVYYPATAVLSRAGCLDYTLPEVQQYVAGSVDADAFPIYCLTDNAGLGASRCAPPAVR